VSIPSESGAGTQSMITAIPALWQASTKNMKSRGVPKRAVGGEITGHLNRPHEPENGNS